MDHVVEWLTRQGVDMKTLLGTLFILVVGGGVILGVTRVLHKLLRQSRSRIPIRYDTALLLMRVVAGVLWICLGLLILEFWGISVAGLWAFFVSAATVIGVGFLATWTMISNATASLFITVWRPFRLGQNVELLPENLKGRVIDRSLMFTALRESNGSVLQIPNNLFFQKIFRVADHTDQYLFEFLEGAGESPTSPETARDVVSDPAEILGNPSPRK